MYHHICTLYVSQSSLEQGICQRKLALYLVTAVVSSMKWYPGRVGHMALERGVSSRVVINVV